MQRLVGDLMDSARMDSGEFNLVRRENVDLAALITKEIADLAVEAGERNVTITKRVTPGPKVTVDSVRIGQVIANLLSNACRYGRNGGAVMVTADPTRDGWCIRFVDTGIGMDAETVARLGEPLFRAERAKEHAVGTGLGFAVTKGIVEAHGGTLTVESELDRGTTVTVLLPYETA
jgi:signal transduction histidine kinase|tara:strand:- start:135 stop:662 length:528 start_codon:yes stop_codon:yes gene_type:complete